MGKKKRKPKRRLPAEERTFEGKSSKRAKGPEPSIPPGDVYDPLRVTMAHALAASTSGTLVVVAPMIVVALIWGALLALGIQIFPPTMVQTMALPPLSSISDLGVASTLYGAPDLGFFIFFIGVTVVRALFIGLLVGSLDEALEYRSVSKLGVLRGLNAFPGVLLYCYMGTAVALLATSVFETLGPAIEGILAPVSIVAAVFLLSFAPAASVRLGVPAREALARSAKGARMSGWQRHLAMSAVYYMISIFIVLAYPGSLRVTANPSLTDWAYVLAAAFLNVVFFAAFIDRWRSIEDYVPRQIRSRPVADKR